MQTVQLSNNQEVILQLVNDLKNFGLNPQEWELGAGKGDVLTIHSKHDKEFILCGWVRRVGSKLTWHKITVASL